LDISRLEEKIKNIQDIFIKCEQRLEMEVDLWKIIITDFVPNTAAAFVPNVHILEKLADKDTNIADKDTSIADKDISIADKDTSIADKNMSIADKDTSIANKKENIKKECEKNCEEFRECKKLSEQLFAQMNKMKWDAISKKECTKIKTILGELEMKIKSETEIKYELSRCLAENVISETSSTNNALQEILTCNTEKEASQEHVALNSIAEASCLTSKILEKLKQELSMLYIEFDKYL